MRKAKRHAIRILKCAVKRKEMFQWCGCMGCTYTRPANYSSAVTLDEMKKTLHDLNMLAPITTEIGFPDKETIDDVLKLLPMAKEVGEFPVFGGMKLFVDDSVAPGTMKFIKSNGTSETVTL
jgi:hypothetical protein